MRRIMWFKIGGQTLHLLKLLGIFILAASLLKVGESSYGIFVTASKAEAATFNPEKIPVLFGWSLGGPSPESKEFEFQDYVGVMMGPLASFFFWLGLATLGLMVYQSGKIIFPLEEYEQKIQEHHRSLIRKAVEAHKKKK
ncbi:MAG TPA: hypothetical protein VJI13_00825 [Candidatus Norongarragalinales archaeon]|nr:hypothetical protein [Candidatus Norongarragalinales archaeon]